MLTEHPIRTSLVACLATISNALMLGLWSWPQSGLIGLATRLQASAFSICWPRATATPEAPSAAEIDAMKKQQAHNRGVASIPGSRAATAAKKEAGFAKSESNGSQRKGARERERTKAARTREARLLKEAL